MIGEDRVHGIVCYVWVVRTAARRSTQDGGVHMMDTGGRDRVHLRAGAEH